MRGQTMTTVEKELLMQPAIPPQKGRAGRRQSLLVRVRREQLLQNPNTWFIWQDDAKNRSYVRKVARQLLDIPEPIKFSLQNIPYVLKIFQNTENDLYTLYVLYTGEVANADIFTV
jgi:hypothetical protein